MTTGDLRVDGMYQLIAAAVVIAGAVEIGIAFLLRVSQEGVPDD